MAYSEKLRPFSDASSAVGRYLDALEQANQDPQWRDSPEIRALFEQLKELRVDLECVFTEVVDFLTPDPDA